jgi:hypothetical protein
MKLRSLDSIRMHKGRSLKHPAGLIGLTIVAGIMAALGLAMRGSPSQRTNSVDRVDGMHPVRIRDAAAGTPTPVAYLPMLLMGTQQNNPGEGPEDDPLAFQHDWPQFRHDAQRTGATLEELNGDLAIRWKRGFSAWPNVFAELAVVQGRIYLANTDGKITCLNGDNGEVLWEYDTGAPILTTPAVLYNRVHVLNLKGRLVTLDTNGQLLWKYDVGHDVYANPVVARGRVFFGTVDGMFYAFDSANGGGGPLWSYKAGAMIDAAPTEIAGTIIFAAENMQAYALRTADGALLWTAKLPGARTWNGHPVASTATGKVFISTIPEFYEPNSAHRYHLYEDPKSTDGPLGTVMSYVDQFVAQNPDGLYGGVILDTTTGQPITHFSVAPDNRVINGIPFPIMYWGSIRPALWQGDKLLLQSHRRHILIDLTTNRLYQPNTDQQPTGYFARGDEQTPTSIGGDRAYGGIGKNVASLDLKTGIFNNLLGSYGNEQDDFTPLTQPLSDDHYIPLPGDGGSDRIGSLIVANGHAYYMQYGWLYCFDGVVTPKP